MTNERAIVESVLKDLRVSLPGAVVLKHNDVGTKGIPDVSAHWMNRGNWIEFKYLRRGKYLKDIIDPIQVIFCHQLATVNNGRCWIVVFEQSPKRITIWQPRALFAYLWPKMAGPCSPQWHPYQLATGEVDSPDAPDMLKLLQVRGSVRIPRWPYGVVSTLIKTSIRSESHSC